MTETTAKAGKYRLKPGGKFSQKVGDAMVRVKPGTVLDLTALQAENFSDLFEPVGGGRERDRGRDRAARPADAARKGGKDQKKKKPQLPAHVAGAVNAAAQAPQG